MQMFMEKYNPEATPFTKNPEKYIRWSVAEVQRLIAEDLFEARVCVSFSANFFWEFFFWI